MFNVLKAIDIQCRIQSYFKAGIPVWDPNSDFKTLKNVKTNLSKNRQMTVHTQVPLFRAMLVFYAMLSRKLSYAFLV